MIRFLVIKAIIIFSFIYISSSSTIFTLKLEFMMIGIIFSNNTTVSNSTSPTNSNYICESIRGVKCYCDREYSSDYSRCFKSFASTGNEMTVEDLERLLSESEVGIVFIRGTIARRLIKEFDNDKNQRLNEEEFLSAGRRYLKNNQTE